MRSDTGQVFRLADYKPADYMIPETRLTFRLDRDQTRCTALLTLERREGVEAGTPVELDGDGLVLERLLVNGAALPGGFKAGPDRLVITEPPSDRRFTLEIVTRLDPDANKALSGLYRSSGNYCTQCEAEGFRRITYFADRPDVLSVYTVRIEAEADANPVLLSNGNPGAAGPLEDGWHFAEWHDPHPKPSYLFALVAGKLDHAVVDRAAEHIGQHIDGVVRVERGDHSLNLIGDGLLVVTSKRHDVDVRHVAENHLERVFGACGQAAMRCENDLIHLASSFSLWSL